MNRYIKTDSYECIDTLLLIPHVECYLIEENYLYSEQIDGKKINLGKIIDMSDNKHDILRKEK